MDESEEDALRKGFTEIESLCSALELTNETQETAEQIYRKAATADYFSLVGRGVSAVAAAALLIACRQTGDIRTASEIAEETVEHIQPKRVHRTTKYLCSQLELGLIVADPHDFIDRIADDLDADNEDTQLAKHVADIVKDDGVALNQAASTIAATAFYYVGAHDRGHGRYTQQEVAEAADVSTLTVRNNYRKYSDVLSEYDISELQAQSV